MSVFRELLPSGLFVALESGWGGGCFRYYRGGVVVGVTILEDRLDVIELYHSVCRMRVGTVNSVRNTVLLFDSNNDLRLEGSRA